MAASGAKGLRKVTLTLDPDANQERTYTVRLHSAEPDDVKLGERVFDVAMQGKTVPQRFDVVREAGGAEPAGGLALRRGQGGAGPDRCLGPPLRRPRLALRSFVASRSPRGMVTGPSAGLVRRRTRLARRSLNRSGSP